MVDLEGLKSLHKHECEATRLVANPNIKAARKELDVWAYEVEGIRTPDEAVSAIVAAALTPQGDTDE